MGMKLYVWENVLRDYTAGMAVALAPNLVSARSIIRAHLPESAWEYCGVRTDKPTHVIDPDVIRTPRAYVVHGGG